MDNKILFYTDRWYVFDNFSAFAIIWNDRLWPTVEHAYQAARFIPDETELVEIINKARSPYEAKQIAHLPENKSRTRSDWGEVKVKIMLELLRCKVSQYQHVKDVLISTKDLDMVENSPTDSFWGSGKDEQGKNMLGKLWMQIRKEISDTGSL